MKTYTVQQWQEALESDLKYKEWFEELMSELTHPTLEQVRASKDSVLRSHYCGAKGPSNQMVYLHIEIGYWIAKNTVDVDCSIIKVDVMDDEQELILRKSMAITYNKKFNNKVPAQHN